MSIPAAEGGHGAILDAINVRVLYCNLNLEMIKTHLLKHM